MSMASTSAFPPPLNAWSTHEAIFEDTPDTATKPANFPSANPTRSYWLFPEDGDNANPLAAEGSTGPLTHDADVCIVGAGITGVGVAYHLARLFADRHARSQADGDGAVEDGPLKVVILEARDFCSGATGRNGGHLTPAAFLSFASRAAAYGTQDAARSYALEAHVTSDLVRIVQEQAWVDEVDLVDNGHIGVFMTPEEEADAKLDWDAANATCNGKGTGMEPYLRGVEWLSRERMIDEYGTPYPAIRTPGHNVYPLKLVTKLYRRAEAGIDLTLHTRTPVLSITHNTDANNSFPFRRYTLHTPRGAVSCDILVHATNAYASALVPALAGVSTAGLNALGGENASVDTATREDISQRWEWIERAEIDAPVRALEKETRWKGERERGITPVRGQIVALREKPTSTGMNKMGKSGWGANQGLEYWFPRPLSPRSMSESHSKNPLIIFGGGREASHTAPFEVGVDDDSSVNPVVGEVLRAFLPGLFDAPVDDHPHGERAEVEVAMEWTGIMAFTKMGDPFVGPLADLLFPGEKEDPGMNETEGREKERETERETYKGQYIAAGYSGHGMPRAFGCAEIVAQMIVASLHSEEWKRPEWFPERYLTRNR
ncbi:FAD dependent oxidoreductase [Hygrophoropsis aurantiaca]|uniref:FAD dependent oxidoreductase n=1 Tax=Hygrophoropsis aurantiaca TaxID=72124 RepID=A0ACB8ANA8_9AGAM|nr:FAD dependent oxidoreductase [Hygrophoropsis aurantiaca]